MGREATVLDVNGPEVRTRSPTTAALAGLGLGAVTFLAYLPGLGRSLDFDSAQTVGEFVRQGPPWSAFRLQSVFNNHPVFSFLEQLVRVVTGRTDAATMRVLPILFGALAVGALTWFGARRHGLVPGLVAGALLACNPTFADLSRSVRGYSLLVLCVIVSTIVVAGDGRDRSGRRDLAYVAVAGLGLATHLYMLPVVAAHAGAVVARGRLDARWRVRLIGAGAVAAVAYAGMAATMLDAATAHSRVFQAGMPWRVAVMATGGGWASLLVAPLVIAGAYVLLRRSPAARGGAAALAGALIVLWAVLQSSALTERFFVWLVPVAAYLAAMAVARIRLASVLGAGSAALAFAVVAGGSTAEPTGYRQAATLIRLVAAAGERSCVVGVGVPPMLAYLDTPQDFDVVTDPAHLDRCAVVVVAAWWPSTDSWFERDRQVIAEAERRFSHRHVLPADDPALVLSRRPLPA